MLYVLIGSALPRNFQWVPQICLCGEIRIISNLFGWKKYLIWSYDSPPPTPPPPQHTHTHTHNKCVSEKIWMRTNIICFKEKKFVLWGFVLFSDQGGYRTSAPPEPPSNPPTGPPQGYQQQHLQQHHQPQHAPQHPPLQHQSHVMPQPNGAVEPQDNR